MLRALVFLLVLASLLFGQVASHGHGGPPKAGVAYHPPVTEVPGIGPVFAGGDYPAIDSGFTVAGPDRPIDSAFTVDGPHCVNAPAGGAGGVGPTPFDPACPSAFQGAGAP